jgi:fructose-1,6-bisphosphatase-3
MTTQDPYSPQELRLLQLLSERYPTIRAAHVEMINLHAILGLPKGTDHYISDIHGAYTQFDHILRHASGAIRRKIHQTFGAEVSEAALGELEMVIYYPQKKVRSLTPHLTDVAAWQTTTIEHLLAVVRTASQKYTRSKVRKRLPPAWGYSLDELLFETNPEKKDYYQNSIQAMVRLGEGETVITVLASLIQSLVVDHLYILGDIFDRGPAAEQVMDRLMAYHEVTLQWGNHDIIWMGAAAGSAVLICNVLRIALRYGTLETLLDGYGIRLHRLARFADSRYAGDPCTRFYPKAPLSLEGYSQAQVARMHKAITMLQFKLEAPLIRRHPEYEMDDRLLLDATDLEQGTLRLAGVPYPLLDTHWPTVDPIDRTMLTAEERDLIADLQYQFRHSQRLEKHVRFLYRYGSMFTVRDGNLLFHGCLPVNEEGDFIAFVLGEETLSGPTLLRRYEQLAREAFFSTDPPVRQAGQDAMWYLWCGPQSPLFGKERMATFERYFIQDPTTHLERKGAYYELRDNEAFCRNVLRAFGADPDHGFIMNGHTPVKKGRTPLMANGKLIVIDGGMSEAYQPVTGIAGYTLIGNSHELVLAAHAPFDLQDDFNQQAHVATPHTTPITRFPERLLIAATDKGQTLRGQLEDLGKLVDAYERGILVESPPWVS